MTSIYRTTFYLHLIIMQYTCNKSTPLALVTAEEELVLKRHLRGPIQPHEHCSRSCNESEVHMFIFQICSDLFPKPKRASSMKINQFWAQPVISKLLLLLQEWILLSVDFCGIYQICFQLQEVADSYTTETLQQKISRFSLLKTPLFPLNGPIIDYAISLGQCSRSFYKSLPYPIIS